MSQLIDQINEFVTNVKKLPAAQRDRFYAALRAAVGPVKSSRPLAGNRSAETRDVALEDLLTQPDVVPSDLRQDYRELCKAIANDVKKRGPQWGGEAVHLIVQNRLLPQPTPGQLLLDSTPGLVDAIIAEMQARADRRLELQQQERQSFRPGSSSPTGPFGGPPPAGQGPGGA